ncbi:MAG: cysteine--tRNA ligase [Hyphomicrobiaceae bacterium]|nr:cysteine--tRNA ligase [Hyphomicrobiaceae bacterium]
MELKLYNTLSARKETFTPLDPDNVRMYVCGPTVYDYAHIGNARPVIVFDVLYRLLRHVYGPDHVTYARNITDVDDKINARAAEEGVPISEITARTTRQFHEDIAALGVLPPTVEPRATDHIEQMKALIERLVENGNAYAAEGHVLFHVPSMPDYGKLSKRTIDEMEAGARVDVAPYKKDPMDFVLWKPSKEGEPAWDSPCGIEAPGRPGWHIECSAMSAEHLGEVFDIHGGGIDLAFPHHENEIAQSRCCFGTEMMAQVWMHNGYLQVEGEKMSKSLGNFITIHDLLREWPGEAIRLAMLTTHYRQPFNWTEAGVREAKRTLDHWYQLTDGVEADCALCADVLQALGDDLNTPKALAAMHDLRREAANGATGAAGCLKSCAQFIGLLGQTAGKWAAWRPSSVVIDEQQVENLIAARLEARKSKDFAEADRIRDELAGMGVALKDGPDGTTWEIAR